MTDIGKLSIEYLRLRDSLLGTPCHQKRAWQTPELTSAEETPLSPVQCSLCGSEVSELHHSERVTDHSTPDSMQARFPGWQPEDGVCGSCQILLRELRINYQLPQGQ
jgi:hypothetical protein